MEFGKMREPTVRHDKASSIQGGLLTGPNGVVLKVVTIWMREYDSGQTKFITLMLDKEKQA